MASINFISFLLLKNSNFDFIIKIYYKVFKKKTKIAENIKFWLNNNKTLK